MPKLCINFAPSVFPLIGLAQEAMKSGGNPPQAAKLHCRIIRAICPKEHFMSFYEKQE